MHTNTIIFIKKGCSGCEQLLLTTGSYKDKDGNWHTPPTASFQIVDVDNADGLALASFYEIAQGPFPIIFEDGVVNSERTDAAWSGQSLNPGLTTVKPIVSLDPLVERDIELDQVP